MKKNIADVPAYIMATSNSLQGCDAIIKKCINKINKHDFNS